MRVVSIGLGAFALGMLIALTIFAQDPEIKSDKSSQATPAAQVQKPQRVRVKADVQKAALVHSVSPMYQPASAKRMDGTVVLRLIIGQNGAVRSARYVSGPEAGSVASIVRTPHTANSDGLLKRGLPPKLELLLHPDKPTVAVSKVIQASINHEAGLHGRLHQTGKRRIRRPRKMGCDFICSSHGVLGRDPRSSASA